MGIYLEWVEIVPIHTMGIRQALLALLASPAAAWVASTSVTAFAPRCSPTGHGLNIAVRSRPSVMMGKKMAWSVGNARKKAKKAKAAKPTAAALRGDAAAKGFGITKERLAKAIGQMTAAEALDYLAGPEPGKAGISEEVAAALRAQILIGVEAAKKAAANAKEMEMAEQEQPASASGPADGSEEAMRKWREYCAEALAAAEKAEDDSDGASKTSKPNITAQTTVDHVAQLKPPAEDVPLFKPQIKAPAQTTLAPDANKLSTETDELVAPPPSGFTWGESL